MLGNDNFIGYFSNNLIRDCDVRIHNQLTGNLVLNKDHIKSFSLIRENSGALDISPSDKVVIEIIGWQELIDSLVDPDDKTCFDTPTVISDDNFLWIYFYVEHDITDYGIPCAIQKCEVDVKKDNAKLTLVSPFQLFTTPDVNILINDYNFVAFPQNLTWFEVLQTIAINTAKGLKILSSNMDNPIDNDFVDLNSNAPSVAIEKINILEEPIISRAEDLSDIEFIGLKSGTPEVIYSETKRPTESGGYYEVDFTFDMEGKNYAISTVVVTQQGNDVSYLFDFFFYTNRIYVKSKYHAELIDYNYGIAVYGIEAELVQPQTD